MTIYYLIHKTNTYNTTWEYLNPSSIKEYEDQFPGVFFINNKR